QFGGFAAISAVATDEPLDGKIAKFGSGVQVTDFGGVVVGNEDGDAAFDQVLLYDPADKTLNGKFD
ncbi:MAG: hypothetical protein IPL78_25045, partial [Chloroflexi bacterium]|nr:hypothetical protein [Chloroflexota bacterium]